LRQGGDQRSTPQRSQGASRRQGCRRQRPGRTRIGSMLAAIRLPYIY
jgi:hypothetical protein